MKTIKYGSRGEKVRKLQELLTRKVLNRMQMESSGNLRGRRSTRHNDQDEKDE